MVQEEADDETAARTDAATASGTRQLFRRLGIRQLGWYANEQAMPSKVFQRIEAGKEVKVSAVVTVLAKLCEQDKSVRSAFLCDESVDYITKTRGEGSFCGYRNIQMLISYIVGCKRRDIFSDGVPSILQIQDLIEDAWDRGINIEGRVETGGIRGTRKHIGTPEAQALFKEVGVACKAGKFECPNAWRLLLDFVEQYFSPASSGFTGKKVHKTQLPPIYLQRPRHSLTIVGFETRTTGERNLLVLDPGLRPSQQMVHAAQAIEDGSDFGESVSLKPYRRGKWQLAGYKDFETLTLDYR